MGATAGMIFTGAGAVGGAVSQLQQARALAQQSKFESRLADLDAQDAITRGNQGASERLSAARRTIGAQRAIQAASGIDANVGTPADLQAQEAAFGALDAQTIRNNAAREAWGYRTNAALNAAGANNDAANLRAQAATTLLTGAAKTYGLYRANRNTIPSQPTTPSAPRGGYNLFRK